MIEVQRWALTGLLLVLVSAACVEADSTGASVPVVESLLSQMTIEEKVGQLTQLGVAQGPTGPSASAELMARIRQGTVGSVLGAYGPEMTENLQRVAVEESRLKIPLLFAFDVIHGFRTIFPVPLAEAASFDPALAQRCARAAAAEAAIHGVHWTYAPMVDIARDPRWGRIVEGAGEDPLLGAMFAAARVRGIRGSANDPTRLLSTAKHFVAYGAPEGGRDYASVDISTRTLHETYLPPFAAAVAAGVDAVMPAFHDVAGIPMHANRALLHDLLREQLGFRGIVVSDFTAVAELMAHGRADTPASASEAALRATVDIEMMSDTYISTLPQLVRNGRVAQRQLDDAVRRVLLAKHEVGLFDDPYRRAAINQPSAPIAATARRLAKEVADKSIVLLKNEAELLPLDGRPKRIAVIGALAEDALSTLGSWSAIGAPEDAVSILRGIREAAPPGVEVMYSPGASPADDSQAGVDEAEQLASRADVLILVVGETAQMTGEARSRASIDLPGAQQALFHRLRKTNERLVVLLMSGRPLAIPDIEAEADAILAVWYLGHEMGRAVADVLFGRVNPSGKLPVTFPRHVGQVPIYYRHRATGRPPRLDEHFSSKYIDQPWTPLFPFGHGLSYTTFVYSDLRLSRLRLDAHETLEVQVRVRNAGNHAGDEVVQLYLRDDVATITRPVRALRAFRRISLGPRASRQVTFELDQRDFAFLGEDLAPVIEPGTFTVFVGGSSNTQYSAQFELTSGARPAAAAAGSFE